MDKKINFKIFVVFFSIFFIISILNAEEIMNYSETSSSNPNSSNPYSNITSNPPSNITVPNNNENNNENISGIISLEQNKTEINNTISEIDREFPESDLRRIGNKKVTMFDGWGIDSKNFRAEIIKGMWVTKKYIPVPLKTIKELRVKYSGDREKILQEIRNLKKETSLKSYGKITIGFGRLKEKYKLIQEDITNNSIYFYLMPINVAFKNLTNLNTDNIKVGDLILEKTKYPHLVLWKGKLRLNKGIYAGEWEINSISKTKVLRKPVIKPHKISFWRKLMFWKKPKRNLLKEEELERLPSLKFIDKNLNHNPKPWEYHLKRKNFQKFNPNNIKKSPRKLNDNLYLKKRLRNKQYRKDLSYKIS